MNSRTCFWSWLAPLTVVVLAYACGGASNEPEADDDGPLSIASAGGEADLPPDDDADLDDLDADDHAEIDDATVDSERCYVTEAGEEEGCWDSAESACAAAGCDQSTCVCTEASANNNCSC